MSSGKFTSGSIRSHLLVMSGSAATGLAVLFLSEIIDMYFLGLLGEVEIAAAVGFAGSLLFFSTSIVIGLSIACGALVSQAMGVGDNTISKSTITNVLVSSFLITLPVTLIAVAFIPQLLSLIGASGRSFDLASDYIYIIIFSMPLLGISMAGGGILRAQGNAQGAMLLTIIGGVVNAALDPVFIFGLGLDIKGAAIATVFSRIAMVAFIYYVLVYKTNWLGPFSFSLYRQQFSNFIKVAFPAILTNLTTPFAIAYVTYTMAQFGDSAVAGNAIIMRIQPLAFAGGIALSSVAGMIAGQNLGAKKLDRVATSLRESIKLLFVYSLIVCFLLWLLQRWLVPLFNVSDEANGLIYLYCNGISLILLFNGFTQITNSFFNNLGVAHYATIMNVFKVTLGTVPFVYVGSRYAEAEGVLWGLLIGSTITGVIGLGLVFRFLKKLK